MAKDLSPLSASVIEGISKILDELTGSEITHELAKVHLVDVCGTKTTKWIRLHDAFVSYQNDQHKCDAILQFCINYFNPARFVNKDVKLFESQRVAFNRVAAFDGWEIAETGKLRHHAKKVETIDEAERRANTLKSELEKRGTHQQVFRYCTPEIVAKDYFHLVEEAIKGLFERIREISCCYNDDGASLIESVMAEKSPRILINNFETKSEKSEHKGFSSLLKSIYSMFRNPESHTPREKWDVSYIDTLDILGMVSLCHRKLDKAYRIQ